MLQFHDANQLLSISKLFEKRVESQPDATAVEFYNERMTYLELNRRANQLARYLLSKGIKQQDCIGLCVERSLEMVVGIMGILKAGAAYVPLDPAYPANRLEFMLEDSGSSMLLTQAKFKGSFPGYRGNIVSLDEIISQLDHEEGDNLHLDIPPSNLAYVIYTSGSTGNPKGVMVEQGGWHNYVLSAKKAYGLEPGERMLQFSSLSWDTSAEEIFPCLTSGSALVLRTPEMMNSFLAFWKACETLRLTVLTLPTAFWHELVTHLEQQPGLIPPCVRAVVIGGERVEARFVNLWNRIAPANIQLFNTYGQTECTAVTTRYLFDPAKTYEFAPIGSAIENVQLLVMDEKGNPPPSGEVGELYVGGIGVGRGYLNQSDLTVKKIVTHQGQRYYRTGDLVREIEGGVLIHNGRADGQIKIRSVRIEPGEVESALIKHPMIKLAVVAGYPTDTPRQLAAYVQLSEEHQKLPSDFRNWLKTELPEAFIPAYIIPVPAFPLTPNGKIDKKALPEPTAEFKNITDSDEGTPRTALEASLLALWRKYLKAPSMGVFDNFFDFGGDSLLIVQIITELETSFRKTLPLSLIFRYPTVAQLAEILQDEGWTPETSALVPVKPVGSRRPFFCVHADGGAFFYLDFAKHLHDDQPFYGLQSKGLDLNDEPFTHITDAAASYVEAIRSIQREGPYNIGGFSVGGIFAYEIAQQLVKAGQEVSMLAFMDAPSPYYPVYIVSGSGYLGKFKRLFKLPLNKMLSEGAQKAVKLLKKWETGLLILAHQKTRRPMPAELRAEFIRRLNQRMGDLYKPAPYHAPVHVFYAEQQEDGIYRDDTLGWKDYVTAPIYTHEIPGDHESIFKEPLVKNLAQTVQKAIDSTENGSSGNITITPSG